MLENLNVSEVSRLPLPLVERSEEEIARIIRKKVEAIKDVRGYHQLSVRMTGKRFYVGLLSFT